MYRADCVSHVCAPSAVAGGIVVGDGIQVHAGTTFSSLVANDGVAVASGGLGVHGSVSIAARSSPGSAFLLDAQGLDALDAAPTMFARDNAGSGRTVFSGAGAVVSSGGASFANGATVTTGPLHVLSEGVYVADGGADVAGGATVDAGVLWVRDGGAAVDGGATLRGGVTVADEGLTVASGGVAVNDGGCAIAGGLAISCGGVTVSSGPVDASGGLQVFAGRTHVGMGLRLTGNGARVDSGVSVLAGGSLLHGSVSIRDLGVDVIGPSTFRGGLGIHGGTSVAGSDIQVAGGIAVSNGRLGLGSNDMFSQIAARGQSSIGPVVSQSDPSDVVFDGPYTGSSYPARIEVQIDSLAGAGHSTDTFAWFKCGIVDGGKARLHPSPSIALPGHAIEQHRNDPVTENGTRANCWCDVLCCDSMRAH